MDGKPQHIKRLRAQCPKAQMPDGIKRPKGTNGRRPPTARRLLPEGTKRPSGTEGRRPSNARRLQPEGIKPLVGNYIGLFPANKYRTAIRTATPFSTCSRIMDWLESATSLSSSTPLLMGPGCIMTTSFLRLSSNSRWIP